MAELVHAHVAYLDVLGFSSIAESRDWKDKINAIFDVINESVSLVISQEPRASVPRSGLKSIIVSDSIILWTTPDDRSPGQDIKSLRYLLHCIETIQYQCALQNVWIRGGVSHGEILQSPSNIAGPAYLSALSIEKVAQFPRVLVDAKMMREIFAGRDKEYMFHQINQTLSNQDFSGEFLFKWRNDLPYTDPPTHFIPDYPFFVNYLGRLVDRESSDHFETIWNHLQSNYYSKTPSVHGKYKWVLEYLITLTAMNSSQAVSTFLGSQSF